VNSDYSVELYRPVAENRPATRAITPVIMADENRPAFAGGTFHPRCLERNTPVGSSNSKPYNFVHFSCIKSYRFEREQ